jgi:aspartate dehydrogenase
MHITLIGYGAIAQSLIARHPIDVVVELAERIPPADKHPSIQFLTEVPEHTDLVLECAGHSAILSHVLPSLKRGIPCAVLSIGALSALGLPEQLTEAARQGKTQCHLLSGAMGAIDALAAAKLAGLDEVIYTGRKPPLAWRGTPAEAQFDLANLHEPTTILQASAREAASLYPKNANVAATLALAGMGFERTQVQLIADPTVTDNIHEVHARGAFGQFHLKLQGLPLADNPKTSTLTVLSALRFLQNQTAALTL